MGANHSEQKGPAKPSPYYEDLIRSLTAYSSYEVGLYMQALSIDVNQPPPDLSPMHFIVENTSRLNILQFLVEEKHGDPLLSWGGSTVLRLACNKRKIFFVTYLLGRAPLPTGRKPSPIEGEILRTFGGDTAELKDMQTRWKHRVMSGRRLLFVLIAYERRKIRRLPPSLVAEVVHYI